MAKINSKKKGNKGENKFANWLVSNGIKAFRDSASGGGNREKADVSNALNIHFEVKTCKKIGLDSVWKKACLECTKTHNEPVLAIHFDGMPENEWLMVMHSEHFLDLLTKNEGVKTDYQDPKFRWALGRLKNEMNSVMKFLP